MTMKTVIETETFSKHAASIWSEEEHEEFVEWISLNWNAGDIIAGSGGARKVRFKMKGRGKSGGSRVIYFFLDEDDAVLLVEIYAKSDRSTMKGHEVRGLTK